MNNPSRRQLLVIFCLASALIAYLLPWVINPGISLSLNAYDLAEWASLHPAVRTGSPPFFTSLLLRLPLVLLACMIVFALRPMMRHRLTLTIIIMLFTAALLPPLEFLTIYRDDPNYQQQFVLAILTLVISMIALPQRNENYARALIPVIALIAALSALIGLVQIINLMGKFMLPVQPGVGGIAMIVSCLLLIVTDTGKHRGSSVNIELPLTKS